MPSLKQYKDKLNSFKNIEKITRTMKLVSASKLRQAQQAEHNARQYAAELQALIARLAVSVNSHEYILFRPKEKVNRILVLLITSDKGLCGAFNNNLMRKLLVWINDKQRECEQIDLNICGKRGFMFFKNRIKINHYYKDVTAKPEFHSAKEIGQDLVDYFIKGKYDEIYLAYNTFKNPLLQVPIFEKFLPIESTSLLEGGLAISSDYIFEPARAELLEFLIPRYMFFRIYYALLENSAGEYGARMTAMDKASQNAGDLIDEYTLLRNRARQASITTELIEIVSGAESLK
jgi:F-type H+-transporting ATPase subunit gamma